jgi:hypothetical protein
MLLGLTVLADRGLPFRSRQWPLVTEIDAAYAAYDEHPLTSLLGGFPERPANRSLRERR